MCIQCSRCLLVYACRLNPNINFSTPIDMIPGKVAMNCPGNFNFVANCQGCYQ